MVVHSAILLLTGTVRRRRNHGFRQVASTRYTLDASASTMMDTVPQAGHQERALLTWRSGMKLLLARLVVDALLGAKQTPCRDSCQSQEAQCRAPPAWMRATRTLALSGSPPTKWLWPVSIERTRPASFPLYQGYLLTCNLATVPRVGVQLHSSSGLVANLRHSATSHLAEHSWSTSSVGTLRMPISPAMSTTSSKSSFITRRASRFAVANRCSV